MPLPLRHHVSRPAILRRCRCGERPQLVRFWWVKPRPTWAASCLNLRCCLTIGEPVATRREAVARWNTGQVAPHLETIAWAARRDAFMPTLSNPSPD